MELAWTATGDRRRQWRYAEGNPNITSADAWQDTREGFVEGLGRIHEHIVNPTLEALALEAVDEVIHRFGIGFLNLIGLGRVLQPDSKSLKFASSPNLKSRSRGSNLHDDYFMVLVTEVLERANDRLNIIEKITEDNDESSARNTFSKAVKRGGGTGGICRCGDSE